MYFNWMVHTLQFYLQGRGWVVYFCCHFSFLFISGRAAPLLRRRVREQPMLFGTTFQVMGYFTMLVYNIILATSAQDELMQHRVFLTVHAMLMIFIIFIGDLPLWVHGWMIAPISFVSWLTFHWIVGFWKAPMVIFGFSMAIFQTYLVTWLEELRWQQFQAYQQLDRERQALEATKETLQCMLSSVWDASCTCNAYGDISSSTSHLELLLGGGQDLVGSCLCTFAANDADGSRLRDF
jgi:hypothetical protein